MKIQTAAVIAWLAMLSAPAWGYYSILDNGEILKNGHYKITGDTQLLTDDGGLNVASRIDMGLTDEFGVRGLLGTGETDLFFGGFFKWMPIPDVAKQPAIGGNVGLVYAKDGDVRDLIVRFEPLASKRFESAGGNILTPYASLPLGIRMRDTDSGLDDSDEITVQLVVGSQLQLNEWKNLQFIAEVGLDLNKAPGFVNLGAVFYFDNQKGMVFE